MTTATPRDQGPRPGPAGVLAVRRPFAAALAVATVLVLLGGLTGGSAAGYGAALGAVLAIVALLVGALSMALMARAAPGASLLLALLGYTLTVVLLALFFAVVEGSEMLDESVSRGWLAAAVIACSLGWITTQVVVAVRTRQPHFDLPPDGEEASVR